MRQEQKRSHDHIRVGTRGDEVNVAVITPYYRENIQTLTRCITSVAQQTYKSVHHFLVADGHPYDDMTGYPRMTHIALPHCGDYGDAPRAVGCAVASAQQFDAIALLDADCWFEPDHIATMVGVMQESGRKVITCPRNLFKADGSYWVVDTESDGYHFNDMNCYLIAKDEYTHLRTLMMKPKEHSIIDDRYLWASIKEKGCKTARSTRPTVNYTTTFAFHYQLNGEQPPPDSKVIADIGQGLQMYTYKALSEIQSTTVL